MVYVESNTGGASGGHAALKTGDLVFHFQQYPDGFFRLERDTWKHFRLVYNDIENRSMFLAETTVTNAQRQRINRHFSRLLLAQDRNFHNLSILEREVRFRKHLAEDNPFLEIDGLGLFQLKGVVTSEEMAELRDRLASRLGRDFAQRERALLEEQMKKMDLRPSGTPVLPAEGTDFVPLVNSPVQGLRELVALKNALEVLEKAVPVRQDMLMDGGRITPCLLARLIALKEDFEGSIRGLLSSRRPDRGSVLLLQMARFQAVSRSIRTGRLLVLDPFPFGTSSVRKDVFMKDRLAMEGLLADMKSRLSVMERKFCGGLPLDEPAYNALENLTARLCELRNGLREARPVRISDRIEIPCRKGMAQVSRALCVSASSLRSLRQATDARDLYARRLKSLYRYNLISSNCVTRLAREIRASLPQSQPAGLLPADFRPGEGATFIPFRFFEYWVSCTKTRRVIYMPSLRKRKLARMYRSDSHLKVYFREFNTVTSSIYRSNPADTSFLLFTDDVLLPRPVFGVLNTTWGLLSAGAGILTLPFDHGSRLSQGFWGVVYSLPELVFSNIRKGSFSYVRD